MSQQIPPQQMPSQQPGPYGDGTQPPYAGQQPPPGPGAPGYQHPGQQPGQSAPEQKKRNWFARHKILTGILAVIALIAVVGIVGGGDDDVAPAAEEPTTETAADDAGPDDDAPAAEDASDGDGSTGEDEAADDDATEEENGGGAEGTRDNPYPVGTAVQTGDYTVTLGETVLDAWEVIQAENQFNEAPPEGRQFVMVPVTAAYDGEDTGWAAMDLSISFVGASGNTFDFGEDDYCGVIPSSLTDQGEMYAGASVDGNVCVSVPADQIDGGAWRVEEAWSFDGDHAFIDLS